MAHFKKAALRRETSFMSEIGLIGGRKLLFDDDDDDDDDEVVLRVLRHNVDDDDGDKFLLSTCVTAAAAADLVFDVTVICRIPPVSSEGSVDF